MKKTITHPDGTTETIEGSSEEIAEYEKKLQRGQKSESRKGNRRILNEERLATDDYGTCPCKGCRDVREWWRTVPQVIPWIQPLPYVQPIYPVYPSFPSDRIVWTDGTGTSPLLPHVITVTSATADRITVNDA